MRLQLTEVNTKVRIEFHELPILIGRDPSADIELDDPALPPFQCLIGKGPHGGANIWNLRVECPLYINGSSVTKASLSPGDLLAIGQSRFVFSCETANAVVRFPGWSSLDMLSCQPSARRS